MTTATTKERVQSNWPVSKVQQETARVMSNNCFNAMTILEKAGPEFVKQYNEAILKSKVDFYRTLGVKTPLELVKAMAEFETNVFGSKIVFWGDDKTASLEYEECACMEQMKKNPNFKPEAMEKMGKFFAENTEKLAKEFGFKGEMKMTGPAAQLTFTKEGSSCSG
jgi:hypothetical protein